MARTKDWPEESVEGNAGNVRLNPVPDTCADVTVTLDDPDADSVTFCVVVEPTCVCAKLTVALFAVIVPTAGVLGDGVGLLPVTPPEHPAVSSTETATTETIEFALLDQRLIRLTTRHPNSACRGYVLLEVLKRKNSV
jgi:hypothetical protein